MQHITLGEPGLTVGIIVGIITMSVVHGFLLGGILITNKRLASKANSFLALGVFAINIILFYEAITWLEMDTIVPTWIQYLPIYLRTAIPVGIYYFVIYFINSMAKLKSVEKLGFNLLGIDILLELSLIPIHLLSSTEEQVQHLEDLQFWLSAILSVIAVLLLLPAALRKVNRYQVYLYDNYSTTEKSSLKWLRTFIVTVLICSLLWVSILLLYGLGLDEFADQAYLGLTLAFVLLLFWIGYFIIIYYQWFEIVVPVEKERPAKKSSLSKNTNQYHEQLMKLIHEEHIYTDVHLSLDQLAARLSISSGYLSQIIKEKENQNLFEFINHFRVEAVKRKLLDDSFHNYSIMGIALESGFNSKSTFNAVFKKFTGMTPSAYKKQQH